LLIITTEALRIKENDRYIQPQGINALPIEANILNPSQ
jgi:hypothetical protein